MHDSTRHDMPLTGVAVVSAARGSVVASVVAARSANRRAKKRRSR
jgi:hypothetical protein